MLIKELFENDALHQKTLDATGFWGSKGAGCLIFCESSKKFLMGKRSAYVEQPHTWGVWGGAIDPDMSPQEAAKKEVFEETGYSGNLDMKSLYVFKDQKSGFQYFNFLGIVQKEYTPTLNWETSEFIWCDYGDWPSPLHFGVKAILNDPESVKTIKSYL